MAKIEIIDHNVVLNGHELETESYRIIADHGSVPRLLVEVISVEGLEAKFEGFADISMSAGAAEHELIRITEALSRLDPAKIEQEALAALECGDGASMTAAIIKAIQEKVLGSEPQEHPQSG